jgi:hypothetical protein
MKQILRKLEDTVLSMALAAHVIVKPMECKLAVI